MPEDTKDTGIDIAKEFGITIDPASWEDPKQSFPGIVVESNYQLASAKYRAATTFRPEITDPLPQWHVKVLRFDARLVLPDGEQVDAYRYGGYDLKKYVQTRDGGGSLVDISSRFRKEWFIGNAWKTIFGQIHPPELLIGKKAMFDFYPTKSFGTGMPSKNVLVPTLVLPPDYTFTGEIQLITVRSREDAEGAPVPEAEGPAAAPPLTTLADEDTALERIITEFLPRANSKALAAIIQALPAELHVPKLLADLATGKLITRLVEAGRIDVAPDGTISLKS